jgi:hypothetical protein
MYSMAVREDKPEEAYPGHQEGSHSYDRQTTSELLAKAY